MKSYQAVESRIKPNDIIVDQYSVWVNENIQEIEKEDENETYIIYKYDIAQYSKDEYIMKLGAQNKETNLMFDALLRDV